MNGNWLGINSAQKLGSILSHSERSLGGIGARTCSGGRNTGGFKARLDTLQDAIHQETKP